MTTSPETLLTARHEHVLVVTLNRPAVGNAVDLAMVTELTNLMSALAVDPGATRCVVLTGAGERVFCSGGDMKELRVLAPDAVRRRRALMEQFIRQLVDSPVPVIAAVNGAAVGGGCEIVLAADFAYGAENATFSLPEVRRAISPGAGGTQNLPRACGPRRAKELILTGATFSAAEALEWGILNRVLPAAELLDAAIATAATIARNAPIAVRQAKKALAVAGEVDFATGFRIELDAYERTASTRDRQEAIAAFAEKREPVFRGE